MTAKAQVPELVSTQWLAERLNDDDVVVIDASFHLPGSGRDPRAEYAAQHIPGACFFDIDRVCDQSSELPHMLPSAELFADACGQLGIGDEVHVVVYDALGLFSAARLWWMLRIFGHERVSVLDGGLPKWVSESRPLDAVVVAPKRRTLSARLDPTRVRTLDDIVRNLDSAAEQVVDARAAGRFSGAQPEPRPGMRSGHIPGSANVPFTALLESDGTFKPTGEVRGVFEAAGVDLDRPVVTSCGSGVTACVLVLGLTRIGKLEVAVFDGSWSQWGSLDYTPVETG